MYKFNNKLLYNILKDYNHVGLLIHAKNLIGSYKKLSEYLSENSILGEISVSTLYTWKNKTKKIRPIIKIELIKIIEKFETKENLTKFIKELTKSS